MPEKLTGEERIDALTKVLKEKHGMDLPPELLADDEPEEAEAPAESPEPPADTFESLDPQE